ncbi:MAG: CD1871A family CXXC motif-containing protein [Bacillota bacterium]|nr:CD1871A family CXXC motif-containing protein [Bacillota bacterium]
MKAEKNFDFRRLSVPLLILGGALMALGIFRGEVAIVLQKATKLCLECVGIG